MMKKKTWKERVRVLKNEVFALALAVKDPRVGRGARILILIAVGYALSPIDLIPDFIPVLGLLDDLVILPLLIMLAVKTIPREVLDEYRKKADSKPVSNRAKWFTAAFVAAVWIIILVLAIIWIAGLIRTFRG
jgi:uncharacterized membrane protein YkvA (DUF1232 family)